MDDGRRINNRGTSLIELIFVMALLAVLAGSLGMGIGLVTGKPADKCANQLKSILQNNRVTTMGKFDAQLEIYQDASGTVFVKETVKQPGTSDKITVTSIASNGVTLQYEIDHDASDLKTLGTETSPLIIRYDRSSGAFKDLSAMGTSYAGKYCTGFTITKGSTVKTLTLYNLTGKISVN